MARSPVSFPDGHDRLLDREALEAPPRLSRDEQRAVAGPDWCRTRPDPDEEDACD